jgi:hypothetical protein
MRVDAEWLTGHAGHGGYEIAWLLSQAGEGCAQNSHWTLAFEVPAVPRRDSGPVVGVQSLGKVSDLPVKT